jgi:hypothetical protein
MLISYANQFCQTMWKWMLMCLVCVKNLRLYAKQMQLWLLDNKSVGFCYGCPRKDKRWCIQTISFIATKLVRCNHNLMNQKECWMTKKNSKLEKYLCLPFKTMTIMAMFLFYSYDY